MDFRAVLSAFSDTEVPMPPSGRWGNDGLVRGGTPDAVSYTHLGISSSTIAKMTRGEYVSMAVLGKICSKLDCDFGDIVHFENVDDSAI